MPKPECDEADVGGATQHRFGVREIARVVVLDAAPQQCVRHQWVERQHAIERRVAACRVAGVDQGHARPEVGRQVVRIDGQSALERRA